MITLSQRRASAAAVTAALVAGVSLAASATSADASSAARLKPSSPASAVSHVNSLSPAVRKTAKGSGFDAEAKAAANFWTAARMKSAKPLDMVVVKGAPPKPLAAVSHGKPTTIQPSAPGGRSASGKMAPTWSYPNLPVYQDTARTNGKVFFTRTYGGQTWSYQCSGAIVNTEGKSTVWTAGHCLYGNADGDTARKPKVWDTTFIFVPAYVNGSWPSSGAATASAPFGAWYAKSMTSLNGWINSGNFAYDNGAVTVGRNSAGYRIADYLGANGLQWNASPNYWADAFGYPAKSPFNGQLLVKASGNTTNRGSVISMPSGMTPGSSGGPWLRNYSGSYGYINGHNDFNYVSSPSVMYSPYYSTGVANLYNAVRNKSS